MIPDSAKTQFLMQLEAAGLSLDALTPQDGVEAMLAYYAAERVEGCLIEEDGDMLLFQWGTNDWGDGPAFEVNITRQLIVANDDEEEPQQLSLIFRFEPSVGNAAGEGNQWCESPDVLPEFRRFIAGSPPFKAVGQKSAGLAVLRYGRT